jgi:GNAT superfamily N-acetyltransferase
MRVVRLMDQPDWQSRLSPIEEIFFATSPSAKTLQPDERQPFKERWLGRYIAYDIESFFVAITEVSTVAGYLAGCLDNPAHNPRFADNGYYASFAPLCDPYPCHLHINLDERYRNRGIGSALIAAFAAQAASGGRAMSVFMRRTNFARWRRRAGTVPMWSSWAARCGHADAASFRQRELRSLVIRNVRCDREYVCESGRSERPREDTL